MNLEGQIVIPIKGQRARPRWERSVFTQFLASGEGADQQLRFVCRIAQDANAAFEHVTTNEGEFHLNPQAKAQFGRNAHGNAYLTVGLVHQETGDRYRLQWEGEAISEHMKEIAVAHDEGRHVLATTASLDYSKAKIWKLGEKTRPAPRDPRPNHDTAPDGKPYPRKPRRNHSRVCSTDLKGSK